jgi:hypothetical protein
LAIDVIAQEGDYSGCISIDLAHTVQFADLLVRYRLDYTCVHMEGVIGYKMASIRDRLQIKTQRCALRDISNELKGTRVAKEDIFKTVSTLHGASLGLNAVLDFCGFELSVQPSITAGYMYREADIQGSTVTVLPMLSLTEEVSGGLLTQPSNIGKYGSSDFGYMPRFEAAISYHFLCDLRFRVGYEYSYISKVMLAGDQIDLRINTTQFDAGDLVGVPLPQFTFQQAGYSLHAFSVGVEYWF